MPQGTPTKVKKKKKSILKRIRQTERHTAINRGRRTRVRTVLKRMRAALASGDAGAADKLLRPTISAIDRSIQTGVLAENTANRYKSRLTLALNSLHAAKAS